MANKKISELPLIQRVSGSVGYLLGDLKSVIPIVVAGTTTQMIVEDFSKFVNAYNAHTGSAGNTFKGPQIIQSTLSVTGNASVDGNLVVGGRITAEEFHTEITTASVIYASGSTKFGDDTGDKHEFTGSINVSGSLIYNGVTLLNLDANTINRLQQATASLQTFTASQDDRNFVLGIVTGSINQATASLQFHSASVNAQLARIQQATASIELASASFKYFYQSTASLQTFTASQDDRNFVLGIVTGSINQATASLQAHSASVNAQLARVYQTTSSLHDATASLQFHSASVNAQLARIQQATASIELASASFKYFYQSTASLQTFTASQDDRNFVLGIVTGSINQATASIQAQTASLLAFTASQDSRNFTLSQVTASFNYFYQATASLQAFSSSQADRNLVLSTVTGSINEATASLQAFTSSQADRNLVLAIVTGSINQATASIQFQTASLLAFTASQDGRNLTLSTVTGSLIGITNGLMAFTAALDNTYATDAQLYELYQATASLQTFTSSQADRNLILSIVTGSFRGEIGGIEEYTASLKGQAIVSSSTQVQNYDVFALNSNLYTSTGSIKGEIAGIEAYTSSLKAAISVSGTNVQIIGDLNVNKLNVQYISSSVLVTSGSNIFGDQSTDTHEFTGSVYLQNSLVLGTEVLGNAGLNSVSSSLIGVTNGLMDYTSSLKGQAIVSSSTQVQNYNLFAVTSSNNTYYGENTFTNKVTHTNGYVVLQQVSQSLNYVDDAAAAAGGVPLGGLYRNGNFIVIRIV